MILLDTPVVFEAMRPEADPAVRNWLDLQAAETLYVSSVTLAELLCCFSTLPGGPRKTTLAHTLDSFLSLFPGRVLAFDAGAAKCHAEITVAAYAAGMVFSKPDDYTAAIAAMHGLSVATRNTAPFLAAGLRVANPWRSSMSRDAQC